MYTRLETAELRFWSKVEKTETCWFWKACINPTGYGAFSYGEKGQYAHRFAYELLVGAIPEGLVIDHLCRVRHCVNPEHMEPVSRAENVRRGIGGQMQRERLAKLWQERVTCANGHVLAEVGIIIGWSKGYPNRICRGCRRARDRRRAAKKRIRSN